MTGNKENEIVLSMDQFWVSKLSQVRLFDVPSQVRFQLTCAMYAEQDIKIFAKAAQGRESNGQKQELVLFRAEEKSSTAPAMPKSNKGRTPSHQIFGSGCWIS
ncbi:conserved hypothetical protein [Ricinus communis]|uniref:Uncharacterized protein n=1 Tax=Ricinus communis TaxID=3988 RepID=B9T9I9_RICCO|nr:conserved hypothetical protein [Ricinus communis]